MKLLTLVLAAAAASFHPHLVAYEPAGARSIEFGTALGDSGYAKLKQALPWKQGPVRADYYFDAFDGKRFLLKNGPATLKVRIKQKAKKLSWQISRYVSRDRLAVDAVGVKIHVTETWEGTVHDERAATLVAAADAFFARLDVGGPTLVAAADKVDAAFRKLRAHDDLAGINAFDGYLAGKNYKFYPQRLSAAKARLVATLPGYPIKLMLGSAPERDITGKMLVLHELEAESDVPLTETQALQAAQAIGHLLTKSGIGPKDLERPDAEGWRYVESQLKGK
ncbi:MAG: hypothetical protein JWM80_3397 [Cyanobacteria bacterium RYN_339]|nr:hypothetical protein [Cyanobacteria bacterium RYN_339]